MAYLQKGLRNILKKYPNDVVFLSALRTPVTRAVKGGLRNAYAEEMLATVRHLLYFPTNLLDGGLIRYFRSCVQQANDFLS
jgi:hypothetical protein